MLSKIRRKLSLRSRTSTEDPHHATRDGGGVQEADGENEGKVAKAAAEAPPAEEPTLPHQIEEEANDPPTTTSDAAASEALPEGKTLVCSSPWVFNE
eukprot:scaffold7381_cov310-Pinguiococcus_pyrenoidosus.AAC.105